MNQGPFIGKIVRVCVCVCVCVYCIFTMDVVTWLQLLGNYLLL